MNSRFSYAAVASSAVTIGLFIGMTALIATVSGRLTDAPVKLPVRFDASIPEPPQPDRIEPPAPPPAPAATPVATPLGPTIPLEPLTVKLDGPPGFGKDLSMAPGAPFELPGQLTDAVLIEVMPVVPIYPPRMLARGIEGHVVVVFDVDGSGRVSNARVESSSHSGFERAAVEAIERFRFQPRVIDGQAMGAQGLRKQFSFDIQQ